MQFISKLKKFAIHCNFTNLDIALQDQLICKLRYKYLAVEIKNNLRQFQSLKKEEQENDLQKSNKKEQKDKNSSN